MTINAIEITKDDLVRIASAVGTVAITIGNEASSMKDIKESLELARLHVKLVHVLASRTDNPNVENMVARQVGACVRGNGKERTQGNDVT